LAESGIVGTAIGLAMRGFRPVVEIQFDGFVFPAFNQITTQLAKIGSRTAGRTPMPVVVRIPFGGGIGAVEHHSESPEALFAHTAGLRVVSPATPADAYQMIRDAVACPDPVIFLEPKARYWDAADVGLAELAEAAGARTGDAAATALGRARVVRRGSDVTLVTYGPALRAGLAAAEASAA
jgi:pyruvate dehydrogenase E1 component beta subunit